MSDERNLVPLHVFRFQIDCKEAPLGGGRKEAITLCSGAFSECTGLEATMEQKTIKEGGRNYGAAQRAGQVTFATVVLKRGMTTTRDLWHWFALVNAEGKYAHRLHVTITMRDVAGNDAVKWTLENAMPIKFKAADLNAKSTEIGIEELHLVHEGLHYGGVETLKAAPQQERNR